jgi:hypothetical protein
MLSAHANLDALTGVVRELPPGDLAGFLDGLAGLQCVRDAGWAVRRRRVRPERYPARNAEIRLRHHRGESYAKLGLAYGLSRFTVRKIVKTAPVCPSWKRTQSAGG